jgi:hypothetical protein
MYKSSSDNTHYMNRTGSHSTKGSRTGIVYDIPPDAQEAEEYYNSLKEQWGILTDELHTISQDVHALKIKLRSTMPMEEYKKSAYSHDMKVERKLEIEKRCSELRPMVRAAAEKSWHTLFYHVAREMLDPEKFEKIYQNSIDFLERKIHGINVGNSELSQEEKDRVHKKNQIRKVQKRLSLRQKGDDKKLVYSTETK